MKNSHFQVQQIDSSNFMNFSSFFKKISAAAELDQKSKKDNYKWEHWEENRHSLLSTIVLDRRFDFPNGNFHLIHDGSEPIACSGSYKSDWSKDIWVCGVRTWTNPLFRTDWWQGKLLLPLEAEMALQRQAKAIVLTFNESSEPLRQFLKRIARGQAVSLGSSSAEFYKDLIFLEDDFLIKETKQKIAVRLIALDVNEFKQNYLPEKYFKNDNSSLGADTI